VSRHVVRAQDVARSTNRLKRLVSPPEVFSWLVTRRRLGPEQERARRAGQSATNGE